MTKLSLAQSQKHIKAAKFDFPTLVCRKISTKEDEENGFSTYVGQAPVTSFLNLPEDENVREYIMDTAVRAQRSGVHLAIEDSLRNHPSKFSVLNGGICIVAKEIQMAEDQKLIRLTDPSIINGSQTRGVIRDFLSKIDENSTAPAKVKFEIIVTNDGDLTDEVSIARNFQIVVKSISILGKRGYFEELSKSFEDLSGKQRALRTSETDRGCNYIPTEKLIQVITALIPESLWSATGRGGEHWNKAFSYSSSAGPLKLFAEVYKRAKEDKDPEAVKLYNFYLQIASEAWKLYETWSCHSGFKGTGLKNGITRDEGGNIISVVDGLIFPILASFSAFVCYDEKNGKWILDTPEHWSDAKIIAQAKGQFIHTADSNPQTMGKSKSVYQSLYSITELVKELSD